MHEKKKYYIVLFLCIAATGCYATIAQVVLIREFLNIFYGNELCLGIVFGAWFFGIASGAFIGAKIERGSQLPINVFIVLLILLCFILPVEIISIRCIRSILQVGVGEYIPLLQLLLSTAGLIVPFSIIIGIIFPFSSKVVCGVTRDAAVDVGFVYIIESMGSLAGGIVFSFFLVSRFHSFKIIAIMNTGIFALLVLLIYSLQERGRRFVYISFGLLIIAIFTMFSSVPDKIQSIASKLRWNSLNPQIELVASEDSKYQHIDIGRQADQYNIFLNGQYAVSFPNAYDYAQTAHLVMTQHPAPKDVLLIGNGLGGLAAEMLLYPVEKLDYVELDEKLLQITEKYLSPLDKNALSDNRIRIHHCDGRYFVKHRAKKGEYDIIFVNVPDPSTAFLNRFYTLEFFRETHAVLKQEGVLATSVSSAVTYIGKEIGSYTGSLYRTLSEAFGYVKVTPGQTNFYFSCNKDGIVTLDIDVLMERYKKQDIHSDYFSEYLFYTLLQPEQVKFIKEQLSKRKDLPVNTDVRPVAYFFNLVLWDSFAGGNLHHFFYRFEDKGVQTFILPIILAFTGWIIYLLCKKAMGKRDKYNRGTTGTNILIALATTEFTGMALEIVLIYAFQNIYGYIYERMGVIVAVFMVGLALGGYFANYFIRKMKLKWLHILMLFEGIVSFYAFLAPFIIYMLSFYSVVAEGALILLVGVTGMLTGFEFPLANKILVDRNRNIALSAAVTDGADHIGAFLGAILTGVLFLPLLGLFGTCFILTMINTLSLILLATFDVWQKSVE